jgi:hypothetical protein
MVHANTGHTVAIFRQINKGALHVNHDALEFPDGKIVLLTRLCEGQNATVLTLPRPKPNSASPTSADIRRRVNWRKRVQAAPSRTASFPPSTMCSTAREEVRLRPGRARRGDFFDSCVYRVYGPPPVEFLEA